MIQAPGPFRLELNGMLLGNYKTVVGVKRAINNRLRGGAHPGFFQAIDCRNRTVVTHDGEHFHEYQLAPRPAISLHTPCAKLVKAVA